MRWVVRIELKEEEAEVGADSGPIYIERARLEGAAELGLTLEDGKRIMAFLQNRVLTDQLHEHCGSSPDVPPALGCVPSRTVGVE